MSSLQTKRAVDAAEPVKILMLGTGSIAQRHVDSYHASGLARVVGAADPDSARRDAFCDKNAIDGRFHDLESALASGAFDAVSNATPDALHHATTMASLKAGKHVLCEKPLALTHAEALEMAEEAEARGLINAVNLTYRQGGAVHEARHLVQSGAIGAVRQVNARYFQSWLVGHHWGVWSETPQWLWRLSSEHGSAGVLGDIGIHILDYAAFGAASEITGITTQLRTFPKAPGEKIGHYTLDANDSFVMLVDFDNGALGTIQASRYATGHSNDLLLEIHGTKGALRVRADTYWSDLETCMGADIHTQRWIPREFTPARTLFHDFAEAILTDTAMEPSFRRGAVLQNLLDTAMTQGTQQTITPL